MSVSAAVALTAAVVEEVAFRGDILSGIQRQLGWAVDLARFADDTIVAVRELAPAVTVRVKLDRS